MNAAEFIYTVLLRPKPLKSLANFMIRAIVPKRLHVGGVVVVLNPADPVISGALTFGVYEKPETTFFCAVCRPGMTFLDIGANVGYYTALASVRTGNGRIIALEPHAESFEYLRQTVAANGSRNAVCIRKAASSENGVATLYASTSNRGDNRLYANEFPGTAAQVETCKVDDLLDELGVSSVDLVKIDVQGFEGHVLEGMRRLIRRSPDITILMEFWPEGLRKAGSDPEGLLEELEAAGLRLFELTNRGGLADLDKAGVMARQTGRSYINIVAHRGKLFSAHVLSGGSSA